jgi:competence protein ComEA
VPETVGWKWIAYAAGAVVLVIAAVRFSHHDSTGAPVAVGGGPGPRDLAAPSSRGELYVHVAGAVRRPGVYRLPAGSRVEVAVRRAGGASRRGDAGAVNLAAPLEDGQQVVVPVRGPAQPAAGATGASAPGGPPAAPISLSSATPEQLDTLDGIGPKLAAKIIEYRDEHGGFRSIDQLRDVEGIGEKRFEALRESLRP